MDIQIEPLTIERLAQMQAILSASAGYAVEINDEIEYFNPAQSRSWLLATSNGSIAGFIRNLGQGSQWSLIEFYVESSLEHREKLARALLSVFKKSLSTNTNHRLRIDAYAHDLILNRLIEEFAFSQQRQLFRHFEFSLTDFAKNPLVHSQAHAPHVQEAAEVLSLLTPVEPTEVQRWLQADQLRVLQIDERIVAAAQIQVYDNDFEIVRIATALPYLRQGYAQRLIASMIQEALAKGKKNVFLKVDNVREPAVSLYKKMGFRENTEKTQIWHSSWPDRL